MALDVDLYSSANVFIKNLPDVLARSWRDQFGDTGSGQIVMDMTDAALADCTRKRILKFKHNGTVRFACVIGPRAQTTIGEQEKASKQRTLGGAGVNALLQGVTLFPDPGVLVKQAPQQRSLGWPASDFDDSTWPAAVGLYRQDSVTFGYGTLYPKGWPDPTAWWNWSRLPVGGGMPPHPVGISYFRGNLVVPDDGDVELWTAADDGFKLYVDGDLVAQRTEAFAWRDCSPTKLWLAAGTHKVAIEGENIARSSVATNYAGFIFAAFQTGFGGVRLYPPLLHTDDVGSFVCSDYPATPPGMTPGSVWKVLLDEWHFLGLLTEVTQGAWTETVDEAGNAWTSVINNAYTVGLDGLSLAKAHQDTVMDWFIDPVTLKLRLYNKGALQTASGVTWAEGSDYLDLGHQDSDQPPTHLLLRKSDGSYIIIASGDLSQPVIGFLESGSAPDDHAALLSALAVFAAKPSQLRAGIDPIAGRVPYTNIKPGQTFTTVDIDGVADTWTLDAVTVADRPTAENGLVGGEAMYAIEAHR